ncbi:hypothetical protein EV363DRAFT_1403139 [Boletus edulis]|uniref:HMG box domain-containing protein n=1 Tax=Boletus edulis BED1 TaxID=1328754 RepID=A0AAD4BII7_BOLED|nr:hypothetical protein EV363DRAFT_1403139 [Boletus edulis]KAF8431085.1 hypothetical protein L210DRAFT_1026766 [Boletus edulis BED1]
MAPQRSRQSKCDGVDGAHLTWAIEPTSPQNIAFAPNLTPVTFNDPPSCIEATFAPILFPSSGSECPARRPTHSKKRGEDHIPRPPNAFILFRSSFIKNQHVSTEVETNHSTLSKIIGLTWQNMPHDERQVWHAKAKKALEEHRMKWPQYAFRPSHAKAKGGTEKRRVREVEPKDMKRCARIAELLVEGKKGAELDTAIQEFDRTHVPEIITRFEKPITAVSYRRSSSAPIDDSVAKKTASSSPSRRVRSLSSQPFERPTEVPKAPKPLTASHSCPDLSGTYSFVPPPEYSFPSRSQPSFDLDPFAFNVTFGDSILPTNADLGSYPTTTGRVQSPTLCLDLTYPSDWTPASSPFSSLPTTPQALSPSPTLECALDSEDPFSLNPFSAASDQFQPCSQQYPAGLQIFDHEHLLTDSLFAQPDFAAFSKDPFSFSCSEKTVPGVGTDLSMSAFLSTLSAF